MQDVLKQLIDISDELGRIKDLGVLLEKTLNLARYLTNADGGSIYVYDYNTNLLSVQYSENGLAGKNHAYIEQVAVPLDSNSIAGYVGITRQMLNIDNVDAMHPELPYHYNGTVDKKLGYKTISMITFPLINPADKSFVGVLQLVNAQDDYGNIIPFAHEGQLHITFLANTAAMSIARAYFTRRLLLRMISMAELRDPSETGLHVERVGVYSVLIYEKWAKLHGIPFIEVEQTKDTLYMGAMMHDVGKVAISDLILKKPAALTSEEFMTMKSHTWIGASLFNNADDSLEHMAQEIILNHHENWDGTGYPGYLDEQTGYPIGKPKKGEEIPITAQMVSIADVFDALTTKRSYKEAWSVEEAVKEIVSLSGKKFNPALVDCFLLCLPLLLEVMRKKEHHSDTSTVA